MFYNAFLGAAAILGGLTAAARGDVGDLADRLPADANSLVFIDVEKLLNSPLSDKEGWREKRASNFASNPLIVPPGTSKLVMGALLDSDTQSPWRVTVMEFKDQVPMDAIANGEQGAKETIGDKPAVLSPVGAYFVQLDSKVLGAMSPPNRQVVSRWARAEGAHLNSAFLRQAVQNIRTQESMLIAMDLQDLPNQAKIFWRLDNKKVKAVEGKQYDAGALSKLIAGVKGLTLGITVTDKIQGEARIEFGGDASILADYIQPLMIEVLNNQGMHLPDLADWKFTVSGSTVKASGELSTRSLVMLASVVDSPTPVTAESPADGAEPTAAKGNEGLSTGEASLKYYQSIVSILEAIHQGPSLGDSSAWMRRQSQRINKMPILNVDPDLLVWGNEVSAKLMEVAGVLSMGQEEVSSRAAAAKSDDYGYYGGGYGYNNGYNRNSQSRGVTQAQKAQSVQQATQSMSELLGSRQQIRALMTERYKIEF